MSTIASRQCGVTMHDQQQKLQRKRLRLFGFSCRCEYHSPMVDQLVDEEASLQ
jgi:hypothetical protein